VCSPRFLLPCVPFALRCELSVDTKWADAWEALAETVVFKVVAIFAKIFVALVPCALYFKEEPGSGVVLSWLDAFYFAIVTASTVGYGDILPQTKGGKAFLTL